MVTQFSGIYSPHGNAKLGRSIGTINRMPIDTCPGASDWCKSECYAMGFTFRKFAHQLYKTRFIEIPDKLSKYVRIHAAGDINSIEYIEWLISVVETHPETKFWCYTRSWRIPEFMPALERLRALSNMQLFASMDHTISENPPENWRVAFIEGDNRFKGYECPEQTGRKKSCLECTYCFLGQSKNVSFKIH